jgi:hypothetical protein
MTSILLLSRFFIKYIGLSSFRLFLGSLAICLLVIKEAYEELFVFLEAS